VRCDGSSTPTLPTLSGILPLFRGALETARLYKQFKFDSMPSFFSPPARLHFQELLLQPVSQILFLFHQIKKEDLPSYIVYLNILFLLLH
jgi:hypothetical protein